MILKWMDYTVEITHPVDLRAIAVSLGVKSERIEVLEDGIKIKGKAEEFAKLCKEAKLKVSRSKAELVVRI
ncbi:MAG: hypothetical protein RML33_11145 [Acidobacteriota bacterium]|nr:hypothetical protein [Leptospiraceae bacterium]MDW8305376.1 hypothetical protein [Acidobacteriota bacterium]